MDGEFSLPSFLKQYGIVTVIGLVGIGLLLYGLMQYLIPQESQPVIFTQAKDTESATQSALTTTIVVDVSGAVNAPGVYEVAENSRLGEVIQKAGGIAEGANHALIAKEINLAQKVRDGQKIYLPFAGESTQEVMGETQGLISINSASAKELDTLPGVGVQTAQKIISQRPYMSLEELQEKKAVSASVFEKIKDNITL